MKHFTLIFTFYILTLAFMPCVDFISEHKDTLQQELVNTSCEHQSDAGTDKCTPFCMCECCHTIVNIVDILHILSPKITIEKIFIITYFNFQHYYTNFFIPPRF